MYTYRDIAVEALARCNLVPRKRDPQPDMLQSAFNILQGVLQEYSNNNLITAYEGEVETVPVSESFLVGEGEDVVVEIPKLQTPVSVLYKLNENEWVPLQFISYNQFYSAGYNDYTVSWQPTGVNQYKMYFRPRFVAQNRTVKIIYNIEMNYSDNDQIALPTPYVELLTRALAYKLSVAFPRADVTKQQSLKVELTELENQLMAANSSRKIITRDTINRQSLLGNFLGGNFIY